MIKVCGLRSLADLQACEDVDLLGINRVPTSRRCVGLDLAVALSREAPTRAVLVYVNADLDQILAELEATGAPWVQLHGSEPPEVCARLRPYARVLKALSGDQASSAASYAEVVDAFLVDGRVPGSGQTWQYGKICGPRCHGRPLLLAGGLSPDNVEQAIGEARPAGVDVASGVEHDGVISALRVRRFVQAARAALVATEGVHP